LDLIRADFTTCSLPANALSGNCVRAEANEPDNCGFSSNLPSLCSYCAASSPNATDSCCLFSNSETLCQGVKLPITNVMGTLFPSATSSPNSTSIPSQNGSSKGLDGGKIAGIVVGSIVGVLLLLALLIGLCVFLRRRQNAPNKELNTPSPNRARAAPMSYASPTRGGDVELPQGARVHHMAALEGSEPANSEYIGSGSSGYEETPESQRSGFPKRGGSRMESPEFTGMGSSPEGMHSGQSEQMSSFKDYYSTDDIHPGDSVATLWAYQPRANDEWELERGDMLKVVGIWDDGWATGYKLTEKADDWETRRGENRDSGLSHISGSKPPGSGLTLPDGEIKAFPVSTCC
jgi:hypothetical protein